MCTWDKAIFFKLTRRNWNEKMKRKTRTNKTQKYKRKQTRKCNFTPVIHGDTKFVVISFQTFQNWYLTIDIWQLRKKRGNKWSKDIIQFSGEFWKGFFELDLRKQKYTMLHYRTNIHLYKLRYMSFICQGDSGIPWTSNTSLPLNNGNYQPYIDTMSYWPLQLIDYIYW